MKTTIVILVLIISSMPAFAQDDNYCHDKESWKEWSELVKKYPHRMDIQMLHAVRIGFCKKIEAETISFKLAKDTFNSLHETAIRSATEERSRLLKSKQL